MVMLNISHYIEVLVKDLTKCPSSGQTLTRICTECNQLFCESCKHDHHLQALSPSESNNMTLLSPEYFPESY